MAAHQQKKYARSIQILEGMSDDERKVDAEFWDELRFDSGAGLAVAQYKGDDAAGAGRTLREVPEALRPPAQIVFALQCDKDDVASYQFCVELLNDARRGMLKSELPFKRKASYWLNLVKLYSAYRLHAEAAAVFREIALAFNDSVSGDASPAKDAATNQLIADSKRIIPTLAPALLETQEGSIFESVNLLKQEKPRIQISLAFLKMALKEYSSFDSGPGKAPGKASSPRPASSKQEED